MSLGFSESFLHCIFSQAVLQKNRKRTFWFQPYTINLHDCKSSTICNIYLDKKLANVWATTSAMAALCSVVGELGFIVAKQISSSDLRQDNTIDIFSHRQLMHYGYFFNEYFFYLTWTPIPFDPRSSWSTHEKTMWEPYQGGTTLQPLRFIRSSIQ